MKERRILQVGGIPNALMGLIYCFPVKTALRFTFLELVAFTALENGVEDYESTLFGIVVAVINRHRMPTFCKAEGTDRERACLDNILRHALAGSLPPQECHDACVWLGIEKLVWAPMVATTLKSAPFCAILPLPNRFMGIIVNID